MANLLEMFKKRILIDGREFVAGKKTGIGRFLEGLVDALAVTNSKIEIILASSNPDSVPSKLRNRKNIRTKTIPVAFLKSEKALSNLCKKKASLFISPYPKLPLFGCQCMAIHTIHDILGLTHPAYKKDFKAFFDILRLRVALKKAALTWYVSSWSLKETEKFIGFTGKNPKVRYNAIDDRFINKKGKSDKIAFKRYGLNPGYILVIGNGLPHKNLGTLLSISDRLKRGLVFVGVSKKQQAYWRSRYPKANAIWIKHVIDQDLPAIIRGAFCLAQPSTAEGYGYPPLEAMACGVPAVVSNIPVLVETTGSNALFVVPGKPLEWLDAFNALENPVAYDKIKNRALNWVERLRSPYGWKEHITDIQSLL